MEVPQKISKAEFVTLMALMTSLIALAMDSMLPAFSSIGSDFLLSSSEQIQLIVAVLFLGYGFGQLLFGPISDHYGRKRPIYLGIGIFMVGSILSGVSNSFEMFLLGRFLQGFGGAAPRIISLALIRDEYSGDAMAQITSLVMTIFILIPAIAPSLGQAILLFSGWRAIFIVLFLFSLMVGVWFTLRQHETLPQNIRKPFDIYHLKMAVWKTFSEKTTLMCMLTSGLVFGIFVGYLGAVQDIFTEIFGVGNQFPLYFGVLALSIGAASFFNARLVMALGARQLILRAFFFMAILSNSFALYLMFFESGHPALWLFMIYMILTFFSVGFLFGNLNALAMEPLGEIAGVGAALLGCVQSLMSVVLGVLLGRYFHDNVLPLVLSFGVISLICILILYLEKKHYEHSLSIERECGAE